MIKSSLEWAELETELMRKSSTLSNSRDLRKMIGNVKLTIADLSRAEVLARTGKKHLAGEILAKVNNEIEMIEEYLIIATLIN